MPAQDQMLQDQLAVMNENYAPHGIQFNLVGTTRTVNANWADYGNNAAMRRSLREGDYKTLNLYFMRVRFISPKACQIRFIAHS